MFKILFFIYSLFFEKTIWVSISRGSDNFPGTKKSPFKSVQAAYAKVPFLIKRPYKVMIETGTYYDWPEKIEHNITYWGKLTIEGFGENKPVIYTDKGLTKGANICLG